jgi:multidrug transporter EmrE-like cation transporter
MPKDFVSLLIVVVLCAVYAMLNVTGTAFIKHGLLNYNLTDWKSYLAFLLKYKVLIGICFNFFAMLVVMKALSLEKFSYVFPVAVGINFAMTVMVGSIIFGDRLSYLSFVGLLSILAGIFMMSLAN